MYLISFTTEPYTLPSVQALSVQKQRQYYVFKLPEDDVCYIMCQEHYRRHSEYIKSRGYKVLYAQSSDELVGMRARDPLFGKEVPVVFSNHYLELGSGIEIVI